MSTAQATATPPTGTLKIFFGYAAGVGKTCAMLTAAHQARQSGVDVVAGYVEPHQRPETSALLEGLEALPHLSINHRGATLREFDLDAAIKRRPRLILVDEMAHTNAPGCRHLKRYQDIEELLRHGIDVYTTVNVQHVESLNDVVQSITGVEVRERVPDKVFDCAAHVELVDIEPEALLERLKQGKIYQQEQARTALRHFFSVENLVALREIALRRTADIVSKTVEKNKALHQRSDYFTNEHLLVCLSSSPSNPRVIRTAARMAEAFHGKLTALFVETSTPLSPENKARLDAGARLAEELGAHLASVEGDDVPWHVAEFAKSSNVSKIVMGRPGKDVGLFHKPNFIDQITTLAPHLDVYVIPDQAREVRDGRGAGRGRSAGRGRPALAALTSLPWWQFSWRDAALCTAFLAASTLTSIGFDALGFSESTVIMAYMLGVLFTALYTSSPFSMLFSALGSVLAFNFFFTEPTMSFKVNDPSHLVTFVIMLLASGIISTLAKNLQQQKTLAARKAHRTALLLETSQKLQGARDSHEIIRETGHQLHRLLNRPVVMYAARAGRLEKPLVMDGREDGCVDGHEDGREDNDKSTSVDTGHREAALDAGQSQASLEHAEGHPASPYTGRSERAVAEWCLRNRKRAGAGTGTLPGARCLYMCIRGQEEALGVVAVAAAAAGAGSGAGGGSGVGAASFDATPLDSFEKDLLTSVLGECSLALEKERIREGRDTAFMQARHEALRANLLRAISHDLRTPLTSISGNAQMLSTGRELPEDVRQRLCADMCDDAAWLISLVENILAVTRLEDGSAPLHLEVELVSDCIEEALRHARRHMGRRGKDYSLQVQLEDDMLLARMDVRLIMQVIVNMIDNAVKYTPEGSSITVGARRRGDVVELSVGDDGPGIPDEAKARLFDMFFTLPHLAPDSRRGLGLGLYLCKSIVAAHGGHIRVEDNSPTGSLFTFTLPVAELDAEPPVALEAEPVGTSPADAPSAKPAESLAESQSEPQTEVHHV